MRGPHDEKGYRRAIGSARGNLDVAIRGSGSMRPLLAVIGPDQIVERAGQGLLLGLGELFELLKALCAADAGDILRGNLVETEERVGRANYARDSARFKRTGCGENVDALAVWRDETAVRDSARLNRRPRPLDEAPRTMVTYPHEATIRLLLLSFISPNPGPGIGALGDAIQSPRTGALIFLSRGR
jgi:hypothetical protein